MSLNIKNLIPMPIRRLKRSLCESLRSAEKWTRDLHDTLLVANGKIPPGSLDADLDRRLYHDLPEPCPVGGVICILDGNMRHGGLTDRLRGILTAYREAKRAGLPFHIHWTHPFPLTDYLIPASVDWRISDSDLSRSRLNAIAVTADDLSDFQSLLRIRAALRSRRRQIHLYTNADSARGEYASLYRELFRPSPALQAVIDRNLRALGQRYWSVSYRFLGRLGDFHDCVEYALSDAEQNALLERAAAALSEILDSAPRDIHILVASDSPRFLRYVENLDPRIYIVPGDISHLDLSEGKVVDDTWMKTFADQQLIMHAEKVFRMLSPLTYSTGFPRFAAEIGDAQFIDRNF